MSDPSSDKDKLPEDEADARFDRAIKNALAMPHKPHKPKPPLSDEALEAMRRIRDERFDELAEFGQVIERLKADGLIVATPGPRLSDRGREWIEDA